MKYIEIETEKNNTIQVHCAFDEMVGIDQLVPHPRNPNKHPEDMLTSRQRRHHV